MKIASLFFALIALAFSALALFGKLCLIDLPNAVLSLIGICCTLMVGISVVDAISVRKLERKINELDKLKKKVDKMLNQSNILFHYTWGVQNEKDYPYAALNEFWKGICIAAKYDDVKRAKSCLENAEQLLDGICTKQESKDMLSKKGVDLLPREVPKEVEESKVYDAFEDRINALIEIINSKKFMEK